MLQALCQMNAVPAAPVVGVVRGERVAGDGVVAASAVQLASDPASTSGGRHAGGGGAIQPGPEHGGGKYKGGGGGKNGNGGRHLHRDRQQRQRPLAVIWTSEGGTTTSGGTAAASTTSGIGGGVDNDRQPGHAAMLCRRRACESSQTLQYPIHVPWCVCPPVLLTFPTCFFVHSGFFKPRGVRKACGTEGGSTVAEVQVRVRSLQMPCRSAVAVWS